VDYVFHLASPAGPADFTQYGIATLRTGSFGTLNALELAKKYKAKFLLASASEVYGDPEIHPQPEDYWGKSNPIGVRSTYTEAKRLSEVATVAYRRYFGLDTHIVRLFYTYGPRMRVDDGRMISNFMVQALRGQDLTVQGDGSQTRSPTYVSDAIHGILALALSNEHSSVNLGWPHEITVLECAQEVLAVTGSRSRIAFQPLPEDDARRRCPNITKARALLNWEPKVDLRSGLERSLDYFRAAVAKA
jgi:dTDP-glucose 4,6-dehydratase